MCFQPTKATTNNKKRTMDPKDLAYNLEIIMLLALRTSENMTPHTNKNLRPDDNPCDEISNDVDELSKSCFKY